jgi:ribose/xylose/arabinose/galactoside ABC-type transport system permease subunit
MSDSISDSTQEYTGKIKAGRRARLSNNHILLMVLAGIFIFFTLMDRQFFSYGNMITMVKNMVLSAVIALAITPLMIARGVDISLGSSLSFTSVVMATLYNNGVNIWLIIILGLVITTVVGFINGFMIEQFKINALLFTLGMMAILQSLALVVSDMESILILTDELYWFGSVKLVKVPLLVWILAVFAVIYWLMLRFSRAGRKIYAIGGDPVVANLFGIKVKKIRIVLYTLLGTVIGVATIIMVSLSGVGNPYHGLRLPLPIISAVILGGVSFMGEGTGNIPGTILGMLIISSIFNGFSVLNIPSFFIESFQGLALILVVATYEIRDRKRRT